MTVTISISQRNAISAGTRPGGSGRAMVIELRSMVCTVGREARVHVTVSEIWIYDSITKTTPERKALGDLGSPQAIQQHLIKQK